jgi:crotonobetainyl-CoA:carnitine CoA-transferase CaiB-like acyl-CoA transferase
VLDVSLFEALLHSLSPVDILAEFLERHVVAIPSRQRVSPGFVPCLDGTVCISTLTGQNWSDLCAVIGAPEWAERMADAQNDGPVRDEFLSRLRGWSETNRVNDVIETMQAFRIAAAMPTDGRTILEQPPFVERRFFVTQPGASFVRPAAPYRLSATPVTLRTPAPALAGDLPLTARSSVRSAGDRRDGALTGLRVIDLTIFLAGGHLTGQLAALGADVIKIESSKRPDGYRFVQAFPALGDQWWELSPLWQGQNLGKRNLSLDLSQAEGRAVLERLIASADVVAENFTPRVIESFGFDHARVRELNPHAVMVRMPAFGIEGPWRDHAGFAYNIEQVGGLAQSGVEGGPLVQPAGIADIVNGQHALVATLAALRHRDATGEGQLIEVSQAETIACLAAEQTIAYQLTGEVPARLGNRDRRRTPQGVYPCRDDRWLALSVANDVQWAALCHALGDEVGAKLTLEDRWERHDEIDAAISAWTISRDVDAAVESLQMHGIAAGALATVREVSQNPQLAAREYYRMLDHPVGGRLRFARVPIVHGLGEFEPGRPARLGEHNDEILAELGLSDPEIAELYERGVVAQGLTV